MIVSLSLRDNYSTDALVKKYQTVLFIEDNKTGSIALSFNTPKEAQSFLNDLEEKLSEMYAENFELVHDEY